MTRAQFHYLVVASASWLSGSRTACPSCGTTASDVVARKHLVTELRRCRRCRLLFRSPTLPAEETKEFYQEDYSQGFTTDLPDATALAALTAARFQGTEKDYAPYLQVLEALGVGPGARVFDFGCSWGYGSWQLCEAGYDVQAFEISKPRAAYARERLGVSTHTTPPAPQASFDVFFSAHVLEHVPSVAGAVSYGLSMLRPGGLLVAFTPNASAAYRRARPERWMQAWGLVHPNFLDDAFYQTNWGTCPHLLASRPYRLETMRGWAAAPRCSATIDDLAGDELLFVMEAA
jgi:2-polyprenyl-3-methyl-5-hydroxy-6-metoxy-1,4-benzoquinol methylase